MEYLMLPSILFLLLITALGYCSYTYLYRPKISRGFIDRVGLGHFIYRHVDGVVLYSNRSFSRILDLGDNLDDVVGHPIHELFVSVDPEDIFKNVIKDKGEIRGVDVRINTLNGEEKNVIFMGCLARDFQTREEVVEVFVADISQTIERYGEMRGSHEKYEKLVKNSGDMVILFDLFDLSIKEANPATGALTGYALSELSRFGIDELIHPRDRQKFGEAAKDLAFSGKAQIESVIVCKSGAYRDAIFTFTSIEMGDKRMAMAVIKDISSYAQKREEEETRRRELEAFWRAAVEREERINELRIALEETQKTTGKTGSDNGRTEPKKQ